MKLTAHFTAEEIGWGSIPSDLRPNALATLELLESLRAVVGVPLRVTSFYRSSGGNVAAGGVAGSQHLDATAADVQPLGMPYATAWQRIQAAPAFLSKVGQVIGYADSSHVHVSLPTRGQRGAVLWATKEDDGRTTYAAVRQGAPLPASRDVLGGLPVPASVLLAALALAGVLALAE